MSTETATTDPKLSAVEGIKTASRYLRGTLPEELAAPDVDHFGAESLQLLKFHGSYQQEDRDARKNKARVGTGKAYMFMLRLKLPGGKLSAKQYLAMDDIAGQYANGTLRLTTRQSIQFHGVLKTNLKATIAGINDVMVSTLGACGDVNRNVVTCPAPTGDPVRVQMMKLAEEIAVHLAPRAGNTSYHEIWLNGENVTPAAESTLSEPIYGKVYLPRKFKTAFSLADDNCTDLLANCLGYQAVVENGQPAGYNLYVGGGQGMTNSKPDTYPLLAQPVAFLDADEVVAAAEAVVKLYRDHGNRSDRKRARIKYLMGDWGVEKFRSVFAKDYFQKTLRMPKEQPITGVDLHHGWHPQADGKWFLGLSVENGRIKDEGTMRLRSGLRAIVSKLNCNVRITAQQDLLLSDVAVSDKATIDTILKEHGVSRAESLSMVQRWSMACPAIPTCGVAISESERALPGIIDQLEVILANLGLADERISVRMTGCPNGCARPYQSEIGIVGRSGDKYTVYIGGDSFGRRLNSELVDLLHKDKLINSLHIIFTKYKAERHCGEEFGGYCNRIGMDALRTAISGV
ncbi:NADPH-dependent assimilatory sulfite reductase hemoprotein subunit [soil metagenome]